MVQSLTVPIPQGTSTVNLGFTIPAGTGYQLGTAGGNNLYRNNAGAVYPYTDNTTVSITGNSANQPSYYYYFYNWQVSQKCASERIAVPVYVGSGNPPSVNLTPSVTTICSNAPLTIQANANNVSNPTYTWEVNGVASTETGSSLVLLSPTNGTVVCTISDPSNCSGTTTASTTFNITVVAPPAAPVVTLNGSTLSANPSTNIQWYINGNPIDGATGPSYVPLVTGDYNAVITANGCSSAISNTISYTLTAIDELALLNQVQLFPNPSRDLIHLSLLEAKPYTFEVFDAIGQLVFKTSTSGQTEWVLEVKNFDKGWYVLKISSPAGTVRKPFVVEK